MTSLRRVIAGTVLRPRLDTDGRRSPGSRIDDIHETPWAFCDGFQRNGRGHARTRRGNPRGCLEHPDAGFRTERSRLAKIDPGGKPAVNIGR
jgi:hypothetical protein